MALRQAQLAYWERCYLFERKRFVPAQSLMLRPDLSRPVGKSPGRVNKDGAELTGYGLEQILHRRPSYQDGAKWQEHFRTHQYGISRRSRVLWGTRKPAGTPSRRRR